MYVCIHDKEPIESIHVSVHEKKSFKVNESKFLRKKEFKHICIKTKSIVKIWRQFTHPLHSPVQWRLSSSFRLSESVSVYMEKSLSLSIARCTRRPPVQASTECRRSAPHGFINARLQRQRQRQRSGSGGGGGGQLGFPSLGLRQQRGGGDAHPMPSGGFRPGHTTCSATRVGRGRRGVDVECPAWTARALASMCESETAGDSKTSAEIKTARRMVISVLPRPDNYSQIF